MTRTTAFASGSGPDAVLRQVGASVQAPGPPVWINNRPGGGGVIAIEAVRRLPADGGHLLLLASEHLAGEQLELQQGLDMAQRVCREVSPHFTCVASWNPAWSKGVIPYSQGVFKAEALSGSPAEIHRQADLTFKMDTQRVKPKHISLDRAGRH